MNDYVVVYLKDLSKAPAIAALLSKPVTLKHVPLILARLDSSDDHQAIAVHADVVRLTRCPSDLARIVIAWDRLVSLGEAAAATIRMNGWPGEDVGYPLYDRSRPGEQISFDPALEYPTALGRLVAVNMSMGPSDPRSQFTPYDPVNIATLAASRHVLPVLAAGNDSQRADGRETMSAWAEAPWVVAVGATADPQGRQLADYSSVGSPAIPESGPDVMAYGISGLDDSLPGTSFAAPRVTQSAGILASMVLTLRHEVEKLAGGQVRGIPRVMVAFIDVDIESSSDQDPLPIAALPSFAVNAGNLNKLVAELQVLGVSLVVEPTPEVLRTLLIWAAQRMPAHAPFQVGAGFISAPQLEAAVASLDGERFAWLFASPRPSSQVLQQFRELLLFEPGAAPELVAFWQRALKKWAVDLTGFELIADDGTRQPLDS